MKKIVAIIIVVGSIGVAYLCFSDFVWTVSSPGERIAHLIQKDLSNMMESGSLGKEWGQIREVEFVSTTPTTEEWLRNKKPKVHVVAGGKYKLELVLIDWDEQKEKGGMIQMSLIDLETGNKVAELGRNYSLTSGG